MAGNLVISQINGGAIGVKNAIINGNFQINQRAVSGTVTLAAGAYGHDRFKAGASGCTYTFATSNNVTTLTISAGSLIQVVEGLNLYTDTYTLSWTGTAQGKIGAGSFAGSGVTGSVTGGANLNIEFNTGTLSLVQLEAGSVASPFERIDYGRQLIQCQRYFYKTTVGNSGDPFGSSFNLGTTEALLYVQFPVTLRTNPTALEQSGTASHYRVGHLSTVTTCSAVPAFNRASQFGSALVFTVASGLTAGQGSQGQAVNTSAFLAWSSEL